MAMGIGLTAALIYTFWRLFLYIINPTLENLVNQPEWC